MKPPATRLSFWPPAIVLTLVQVAVAFAILTVSVMAPVLNQELGISLGLIGSYGAVLWGMSLITILLAGNMLARFGPARISQFCCLLAATGMFVGASDGVIGLVCCAALIGFASGPETPASSQLLMRLVEPARRPFVFSLKQTGMPAGSMLAGAILPALLVMTSWRSTMIVVGIAAVAAALAMEPIRRCYDVPTRNPIPQASESVWASVGVSLKLSVTWPGILPMSLCALSFVAIQFTVSLFMVSALVERMHYSLALAGSTLAIVQASGVLARIIGGAVAGRWASARTLIVGCGIGQIAIAALMGLFTPTWPFAAVAVWAVFAGAVTNGWNGLMLAEVARLAPPDRVGQITSGVLMFGSLGMIVGSLAFGWLAGAAGVSTAFLAFAFVPLLGLWGLLRRRTVTA